ncbi:VacJ family lipoprotein [uncultured Sphingomonas sp.]|uniref:MlaA family lipoprotein n=1 Tax=uncultured Sphingomonas sp. TaxID=158754 RepID=UPI00262F2E0B|nr:VacJ family lipoprotein [uncultured Sphingomonas sp.]
MRLEKLPLSFQVILFVALLPSPMQSAATIPPDTGIRDAVSLDVPFPPLPTPDFKATSVTDTADQTSVSEITIPSSAGAENQPGIATQATQPVQAAQGDIVVEAHRRNDAGDPLHALNEKSFEATQAVDRALVAPVAFAYKRHVPEPVRDGLRNFLKNLREPIVFVNFLLQLKPGKAAETAGRFALNSTVGVAGLVDIAKRRPFNLPRRPNGFADTLGYYGVKPGPFFFLPLIGPTTLRDAIGGVADRALLLGAIGAPFNRPTYTVPATVLGTLDRRIEFDEDLKRIRDDTADPYLSRRTFYLCKRQAEIDALHGHRKSTVITRLQAETHNDTSSSARSRLQCDRFLTHEADVSADRAITQR